MPQMKPNLVTGAALTALAAAFAFAAAPAAAKPNDDNKHDRQTRVEQRSSDNSGQRGRGWAGFQQRSQPQGQAPAQQAREQRSWTPTSRPAQRDWNGQAHQQQQQQRNWAPQAREQWRQRQYSQRGETPPVQQADRTQNWGEQRERNRSYSDPNRNTTYRNGSNDRNWRGNDRDNRQWDRNRRGGDSNWRDNNHNWRGNDGDHRRWDRNWRSNNRYDWQRYRSANRNHYHIGRYYAPYRNYSYRRLSIGFYLDSLFFGSNYWINDPYEYRLPEAYGPYRWVRYYDDALLVDIYSGEVVDVIYDFFW
jgi:hypothetical protein